MNPAIPALDIGIFKPGSSVFVAANAGAGKTSLLVNRVLSLLLHGSAPSKILCLTFTNAAAAEMTMRVQKELGTWLMAEEAVLDKSLHTLLGYMPSKEQKHRARNLFATILESTDGLRIQTIHAFCQSLLRRFPIEANINPHFSVIDDRTEKEMLQEARLRLFGDSHRTPELQHAIHKLAQALSEQGFNDLLLEIVANKSKFNALFSYPGKLNPVLDAIRKLSGGKESVAELITESFTYREEQLAVLRKAMQILLMGEATDVKTGTALAGWLDGHAPKEQLISQYTHAFLTSEGKARQRIFTKKTITDEPLIKALLEEQARVLAFNAAYKTFTIAENTRHMLFIAEALLSLYEALKRNRGAMDYDDLIFISNRILRGDNVIPWVLFKLDGGIDHVLVDEAQDTSPEQWMVIHSLTQEFFAGKGRSEVDRSLFIVGDEKQSIYSFQGADVAALGKMQRYFRQKIQDAGMSAHDVALKHSFRSTPEVLSAVDAVFAVPESRAGLMFEDGDLKHITTRAGQKGLVELAPLFMNAGDEQAISASSQLVAHMASTIRDWLDNHTMLDSRERPIEPKDIMILVRSRGKIVGQLVRAFKRQNIPVAGIDRMLLGDNLAVQDMLALAQFLLLPEDDLTLATLLKSPICDATEEELFTLAWNREDKSLWEVLRNQSKSNPRFAKMYQLLYDLRSKVDFISPFELFSYVLDNDGARKRFIGRMGEEYADPLDEFLSQALIFERSHPASMQAFLHWIRASDSEIKRDMEQGNNAVRIMTIHGAKGLQAPIIMLPDTTEPPQIRDRLLWHEYEPEPLPLWSQGAKHDDRRAEAIRNDERQLMFAEYRRLLYVALTRAEDRLYIYGATNKKSISEQSWYHLVKQGLEPVATVFTTDMGEGLRVGDVPAAVKTLPATAAINTMGDIVKRFAFLHTTAPAEPTPTRPLTPSKLLQPEPASASPLTKQSLFQRGNLIHTLLQHLPNVAEENRQTVATHLAKKFSDILPADMISVSITEVIAILKDKKFAFVFGPGSMAEVPVVGNVEMDGRIYSVSGQIDRLCIQAEDIWIVDYKSNLLPPKDSAAIPKAYKEQMGLYKALLAQIYSDKQIHTALLWTATSTISILDETL